MIPILLGWDPLVVGVVATMGVNLAVLSCCFLRQKNYFAENQKKSRKGLYFLKVKF